MIFAMTRKTKYTQNWKKYRPSRKLYIARSKRTFSSRCLHVSSRCHRRIYNNYCRLIESRISLLQKIDYVLVYSEPESGKENDEEEKEKAEIREKYEENLKKQGLIVEHVTSDEQVCKPGVNLSILFT